VQGSLFIAYDYLSLREEDRAFSTDPDWKTSKEWTSSTLSYA